MKMRIDAKSTKVWGLAIGIGLLLVIIVLIRQRRGWNQFIEGFQYKTLNLAYNKEVFLVGATSLRAPSYENGVTYADAAKVCQAAGATVATMAQLRLAQDASANWCRAGGWIDGDANNLYYPENGTDCPDLDPCADGTATRKPCIRKIALPANQKGFATCYGVKPEIGSETIAQYFNRLAYSVMETAAVQDTMTGTTDTESLNPITFTPSQALYALEQTRFTTSGIGQTARKWLRANLETMNTAIRNQVDPDSIRPEIDNENITAWRNAKTKSCDTIAKIRGEIVKRLEGLKAVIAAVEGRTKGTFYAKQENMDFQRQIAYVCQGFTAAQSPACRRMASIDFDIFYKPNASGTGIDTKVLGDLENLNYELRFHECYIQRALLKLQILSDYMMCPAADEATMALLGNYKIGNSGTYYPDTCEDLSKNPDWAALTGDNEKRFTIRKNIGYVSVDVLRQAFEEISPFFNYAGYQTLFEGLLQNLSILIRIPELNDYNSSDENFKTFPARLANIVSSATTFFT